MTTIPGTPEDGGQKRPTPPPDSDEDDEDARRKRNKQIPAIDLESISRSASESPPASPSLDWLLAKAKKTITHVQMQPLSPPSNPLTAKSGLHDKIWTYVSWVALTSKGHNVEPSKEIEAGPGDDVKKLLHVSLELYRGYQGPRSPGSVEEATLLALAGFICCLTILTESKVFLATEQIREKRAELTKLEQELTQWERRLEDDEMLQPLADIGCQPTVEQDL